jgi:hypothetical protein
MDGAAEIFKHPYSGGGDRQPETRPGVYRSCKISCLHVHSATASVLELRPAALRSELAYRALRVSDSSPLAGSGSLSKNFFSWQRGHAATWEQRTFAPVGMCPD